MKDLLKAIFNTIFSIPTFFIGRFSWAAPPWLQAINNYRKNNPKPFWGFLLLLLLVFSWYQYDLSLPKPVYIVASITAPDLTPNISNAKPDSVLVDFDYDFSALHAEQLAPEGEASVARIDLVGKEVPQGITIEPAMPGKWQWQTDRRLVFTPEKDWPAGTEYKVTFAKNIFVQEARFKQYDYSFQSPAFAIQSSELSFYQDPRDMSVRRVVATLTLSHPVDAKSLESKLSMSMRAADETASAKAKAYNFTVTYDQNQREAYVQSETINLPDKSNYMSLELAKGVESILGGEASKTTLEKRLLIHDVYSFLKISNAQTKIFPNEKQQPEQLLMLAFTDDIAEEELLNKLEVYLLPKINNKKETNYWNGPREVTQQVVSQSEKLNLRLVPNEKSFSKHYNFVFDVPEGRYLYVNIKPGLTSVNRFIKASLYDNVLIAPSYPKTINIMGDGSVLTFSGENKLSLLSRGLNSLKISVGKVMPDQIHHLVNQTSGDIKDPYFSNYQFSYQNVADYGEEIISLKPAHPKEANYAHVDLSKYLVGKQGKYEKYGLFFVEVKGWNKHVNREIYGVSDKRLIMVTDLGLLVKDNADHSHEVFVQSIQTGKPVANAQVALLGKNGIALFKKTSSSDGHVSFPNTKGFENEKQPNVYLVKTQNDMSFIPFQRYSRQINYSKFDVGGVSRSRSSSQSLSAYVFTDRGIYRPGEAVNIAAIVKSERFDNTEGIPLEVVILGPRRNETKVEKVILPEKGLFDFNYPTHASSDTGLYQVDVYLVRSNKDRGRMIGSGTFKVEEFQPDTLKIESKLVGAKQKGWSTEKSVVAKVELKNLFGAAAQDRKITGKISVRPSNFNFKQYKDYAFTDPYKDTKASQQSQLTLDEKLADKISDAEGRASFEISLDRFDQGTYTLDFTAEGFEQGGGRSVIAKNRMMLSPLPYLVGYKSDGKLNYININGERSLNLIVLNANLATEAKTGLKVRLKEIQHVSTLIKQKNGTFKYQTVDKEKEINAFKLDIAKAGTDYKLPTHAPGDFVLEIYNEAALKLSSIHYSVVGYANLTGKLENNAELQLKLNKKDYKPGELIEMNIRAPYVGSGLITIETDKVHAFKWFSTTTESAIESISVPMGLEGNAYVNVSFVRDINSKEIFTSPLSYAVEPFTIDRSKREVEVVLGVDEIVLPGKAMNISYSSSADSKAIIFAVDEGILQVANYKTPAPLDHFLRKRSLDVKTLQILDLIMPEFNLLKEFAASGGGMADMLKMQALAKNLNPFSRKVDAPAVYWSGVVDASEAEKNLSFTVPDTFSGTLRVMAVAVSDNAMGVDSASVLARGPFVISPYVLTQAAPGDEFQVTVGVANIVEGSGKDANVSIEVQASKHLEIVGVNKATLKISEGAEGKANFKVKAKDVLGAAELEFKVRLGKEEASRSASLSIRPAMPYYSSFDSGYEKDGTAELPINRALYADLASQKVSASASPLVLVDGLSSYLEHFPHGCTEQVVSQVFPLLGLMTHPGFEPRSEETRVKFTHLIDKLRERQLGNGGFSFWPGGRTSAEFPSVYVMHFLIEARDLGYSVPQDMIQRGKDFLNTYVSQEAANLEEALVRANAIYLLTRLGDVTTNYLVHLQEYLEANYKKQWQSDLSAVYMAATYQLLQKQAESEKLIDRYKLGTRNADQYGDFFSPLTQDAQYLYLLAKHFEPRARKIAGEELLQLIQPVFEGQYNTIASAYSILALGAYSKLVLGSDYKEAIDFSMQEEKAERVKLSAQQKPFMSALYTAVARKIIINSQTPLFYLNAQSGFDKNLPSKVVREGLEISREFLDDNGKKISSFEQGKEITVKLRIRALDKAVTNVAVVDLLPGGFEVIRSSVPRTAYNWRADYVDVREDRIVIYGDFDTSLKELAYRVKLTAAGHFVVPPAFADSMYNRAIRGSSKAGEFEVIPAK